MKKKCSKCKEELDIDVFYKHKRHKDGLSSQWLYNFYHYTGTEE
jgi:hypothetical protein